MKRVFILIAVLESFLFAAGCSNMDIETVSRNQEPEPESADIASSDLEIPPGAIPGIVSVKFNIAPESEAQVREMFPNLNIKSVRRTFRDDPRYPKRIKASGMDRWYDIFYDETAISMTKAASSVFDNGNVEDISFSFRSKLNSLPTYPFNDPYLIYQWHFINYGTDPFNPEKIFPRGVDINVKEAWEIETGSEEVIVAVCDEGIDYTHEDLVDAMWVNEAELNGLPGVDDDGNGYVDDIYGYNFVNGEDGICVGEITPSFHGTQVAGIIGAVNNNGIGVCGVAGGDGTHKGVRLMCVQTIDGNIFANNENTAEAFYYAANNGAVILNCSWGYLDHASCPSVVADAMDYFLKFAGQDDNGNQIGPISGGVIVASAGNEATSVPQSPASHEKAISVSSFSRTMKASSFTNYDDGSGWVDICAPGGEGFESSIYSTSDEENSFVEGFGKYSASLGTSMAAPHVTGVAALVASHFKGQGFTGSAVRNIVLSSANKDLYDHNPKFRNGELLGVGRVDAAAALKVSADNPPKTPLQVEVIDVQANTIAFSIILPVPGPGETELKYADLELYQGDFLYSRLDFDVKGTPGEAKIYYFGVGFSETYSMRVYSKNLMGARIAESNVVTFTTSENTPPTIEPLDPIPSTLHHNGKATVRFTLSDSDYQNIRYSISGETEGMEYDVDSEGIFILTIDASKYTAGNHSIILCLNDSYVNTEFTINFTVLPNAAPDTKMEIGDQIFDKKGQTMTFDLSRFFSDPDDDEITYTVINNSATPVSVASVSGSQLIVKNITYGCDEYTIEASDAFGGLTAQTFRVLLRDNSSEMDFYPQPVVDVLHIRAAEEGRGTLTVYNATGSVLLEQDISYGPFSPATVDLSGIPGGNYPIVVKTVDKTIRKTITKR